MNARYRSFQSGAGNYRPEEPSIGRQILRGIGFAVMLVTLTLSTSILQVRRESAPAARHLNSQERSQRLEELEQKRKRIDEDVIATRSRELDRKQQTIDEARKVQDVSEAELARLDDEQRQLNDDRARLASTQYTGESIGIILEMADLRAGRDPIDRTRPKTPSWMYKSDEELQEKQNDWPTIVPPLRFKPAPIRIRPILIP